MSATSRIRRWWTEEEDHVLRQEAEYQLNQGSLSDWNRIAAKLPGRTNKDCRKRWSKIPGHLKKGVWCTAEDDRLKHAVSAVGYRWTHVAKNVGTRNADQCAKRWHHFLDPNLDHSEWLPEDDTRLLAAVASHGRVWKSLGEKEFPGRSATELKNRFVILERRSLQAVGSSASQINAGASTVPSSSQADVDMEDSDSASSLSDEDRPEINSDTLPHSAFSTTSPGSNHASQTASALATPGSYAPWHGVGSDAMSQGFPFTESELTTSLQPHHGFGPGTFLAKGTFLNQPESALPPVNQIVDLDSPWGMTSFSPSAHKGKDAMKGVAEEQGRHTSTLTLEDVQPQMVTRIINMLYESKSAVKVNISSQHKSEGDF